MNFHVNSKYPSHMLTFYKELDWMHADQFVLETHTDQLVLEIGLCR